MPGPLSGINDSLRSGLTKWFGPDAGMSPSPTPGGDDDAPLTDPNSNFRVVINPGGRINIIYDDPFSGPTVLDKYFLKEGETADGGGSSFNDQLSAAQAALSGYLQASSLADARRQSAFDQMMKAAQFSIPAGATQMPGQEEGGFAHALAAQTGMKSFTPAPLTKIPMNPGALATEPNIGSGATDFLNRILAAGGARGGAQ